VILFPLDYLLPKLYYQPKTVYKIVKNSHNYWIITIDSQHFPLQTFKKKMTIFVFIYYDIQSDLGSSVHHYTTIRDRHTYYIHVLINNTLHYNKQYIVLVAKGTSYNFTSRKFEIGI